MSRGKGTDLLVLRDKNKKIKVTNRPASPAWHWRWDCRALLFHWLFTKSINLLNYSFKNLCVLALPSSSVAQNTHPLFPCVGKRVSFSNSDRMIFCGLSNVIIYSDLNTWKQFEIENLLDEHVFDLKIGALFVTLAEVIAPNIGTHKNMRFRLRLGLERFELGRLLDVVRGLLRLVWRARWRVTWRAPLTLTIGTREIGVECG